MLIDGLLIGVMMTTVQRVGPLVAIALAVELLSLGLSTRATIQAKSASRARILATCLLAILPALGAAVGFFALAGVGGAVMEAVLAFTARHCSIW